MTLPDSDSEKKYAVEFVPTIGWAVVDTTAPEGDRICFICATEQVARVYADNINRIS